MDRYLRRKMLGQSGLRCDATNPFYKQNMKVFMDEQKAQAKEVAARQPASTAASLTVADEILLRVAPAAAGLPEERVKVLQVIERDKADLVAVVRELGEALDGNAELNTYTGEFCTLVHPDWFGRLRRALERHTGVRVMDKLNLP